MVLVKYLQMRHWWLIYPTNYVRAGIDGSEGWPAEVAKLLTCWRGGESRSCFPLNLCNLQTWLVSTLHVQHSLPPKKKFRISSLLVVSRSLLACFFAFFSSFAAHIRRDQRLELWLLVSWLNIPPDFRPTASSIQNKTYRYSAQNKWSLPVH